MENDEEKSGSVIPATVLAERRLPRMERELLRIIGAALADDPEFGTPLLNRRWIGYSPALKRFARLLEGGRLRRKPLSGM
jgi:hypothetical protein